MKTGMNLLLWTTEVTPEHDGLLDQIKALGFDAVEVPVFALDDPAPYERLGKRLKGLGLGATAVTVMSARDQPDLARPGDPRRRPSPTWTGSSTAARRSAARSSAGRPTRPSATSRGRGRPPTSSQHGVDTLRKAAENAQGRGIRIAVEYLNRFEIYFLTTAADTARFVRAVDHPSLRMMYDSFHAHIEEKDQAAAIASCAAETIHVHVSENDRGIPGTGQVDWDSFWSAA